MRIERKIIKKIEDINKGDILTVLNFKDLMKMKEDPDYGRGFSTFANVFMPNIIPSMAMLSGEKVSISFIDHKASIIRIKDIESGELNRFNWSIKYFKEYSP